MTLRRRIAVRLRSPIRMQFRSASLTLLLCAALALVCESAASLAASPVIPLHGVWRVGPAGAAGPPPSEIPSDWAEFATPGAYGDGSNTWFWFVRDVDLGAEVANRVALLRLESACFLCEVWLNGRRCGEAIGGYAPIAMDLSAAARAGTNRLALRLGSWVTVATNRYPAPDSLSMSHSNHRVGLWQSAELFLKPPVYLADTAAICTVEPMRLTVETTVVNTLSRSRKGRLVATVHEQVTTSNDYSIADAVFAFDPVPFEAPGNSPAKVTVEAAWPEARLWWPHDPHLYALRVTLIPETPDDLASQDEATLRFGFREVRVQGTDLLLNGKKLVLRGASMTRYASLNRSKAEARAKIAQSLAWSRGNAVRLHYDPMEQCVLDAADELGALLLVQSPLLYTIYSENRRSFWNEARDQWLRYIRHSRHHPSVVIWAVANEGTFNDYGISTPWAPSQPFLAEMARQTRAADPTRPVTSSHDFTLGGASDFFDAVHAWGFETDPTFPKSARQWQCYHYWTFYRYNAAKRYRRDRPWSNDEWAEGFNLHMGGVLFGDRAYVHADGAAYGDVRNYWTRLAQATSTYMGILEQRRQPYFCSIMPFGDRFSFRPADGGAMTHDESMVELAHKAMAAVALAPLEWNSGVWAGEPYTREFELMNDGFVSFDGTIAWAVLDEHGQTMLKGQEPVALDATEHRCWTLAFAMPPAAAPAAWQLQLQMLDRDGKERYLDRLLLGVIPRAYSATVPNVCVWPRTGTLSHASSLPSWSVVKRLPDIETVVVTPRGSRLSWLEWRALERFVERGGRALILEDENLPRRFGGVPLRRSNRECVIAHRKTPNHPVVRDLPEAALRYWIGAAGEFHSPPARRTVPDFVVARNALSRPTGGNSLPILEAGLAGIPRMESNPGLTLAPLLEVRHGQGCALFCTLLLAEAAARDEPGAAALLAKSLAYLADARLHAGSRPRTAFAIGNVWRRFGAQTVPDRTAAGCLLVDATAPEGAAFLNQPTNWLPHVRHGAQMLLHRLSETQIAQLGAMLGLDLQPVSLGAPDEKRPYPTRLDWLADDPLRWGIGHFETDWIDTGWLSMVKARNTIARVGLSGQSQSFVPLTSHGALTVISLGSGRIVVDQVCWDDPIRNTYIRRRAEEYAAQLLSNLGVARGSIAGGPLQRLADGWNGVGERIRRLKR